MLALQQKVHTSPLLDSDDTIVVDTETLDNLECRIRLLSNPQKKFKSKVRQESKQLKKPNEYETQIVIQKTKISSSNSLCNIMGNYASTQSLQKVANFRGRDQKLSLNDQHSKNGKPNSSSILKHRFPSNKSKSVQKHVHFNIKRKKSHN